MRMLSGGPSAWLGNPELRRFATFLVVGGLNTLVGYAIYAALILLGLPSPAAVVLGTIFGVLFNFFSTGRVVFKTLSGKLLPRFLGVYAVQMGLNIAAITLLERFGVGPLLAGALVLPPLAIFSYLAMRRFVFS
jgi:putative flippase GtrA